jgi:hypothetical protein
VSDLPSHEATARSYAADSADVVLRRALTAVLTEYERLKAENVELREELDDAVRQYDELIESIGGVSPG